MTPQQAFDKIEYLINRVNEPNQSAMPFTYNDETIENHRIQFNWSLTTNDLIRIQSEFRITLIYLNSHPHEFTPNTINYPTTDMIEMELKEL